MPLPLILGIAAGVAATGGVGTGIYGGYRIKEANDTVNQAKKIQNDAIQRLTDTNESTTKLMDSIGTQELNILKSFDFFSNLIEKIQGRPEFNEFYKEGVSLPKYDPQKIKEVSTGAGILIGGLSGAAAGTAGGFAAAGATTSAVMALGTASTGTAIASLSGAAATNATLAALGGGAVAAGGGGIALGTTILGATTLGVGLLIGGIIFSVTGSKLSDKADEAFAQAKKTESDTNSICTYLNKLSKYSRNYKKTLTCVQSEYNKHVKIIDYIINYDGKVNWSDFSEKDKLTVQNTALLVGMLYKMCKVRLVLSGSDSKGQNNVNTKEILDVQMEADALLENIA